MARRFSVEAVLEAKDRASPIIGKAVRNIRTLTKTLASFVRFNTSAIPIVGRFIGVVGRLSLVFRVGLLGAVIAAGVGLAKLFKILRDGAAAFAESERAISKLESSLRSAGSFTVAASKNIQAFANDLQASTTATQSQILELVALAKSFGASNEQAKALAATSLDFAAGAQLNATEAVRRLGRALQGSAADVANFAPAIRNLTREQLLLGEATTLVAEQFKGQAAAALGTYLGVVQNLANAQTRLDEAQGELIIGSAELRESILTQARLTDKLTVITERSKLSFVALATAWQDLITLATRGKVAFALLFEALGEANFSFGQALVNLAQRALGFGKAVDEAKAAAALLREEFRRTVAESEDLTKNLATLTLAFNSEEKALDALFRAHQREVRLTKEHEAASQALGLTLQRLGLRTLAQVKKALDENAAALRRVEEGYAAGEIGAAAFEKATADLALEHEGLQAVLDGTAASVDAYKLKVEEAAGAQTAAKASTDLLATSTDSLARSQDAATRSIAAGTQALSTQAVQAGITAREFDALARSQGNAAAVAAALQQGGALELRGTRIRLRGGSRLVDRPPASAFERDSGAIFLR